MGLKDKLGVGWLVLLLSHVQKTEHNIAESTSDVEPEDVCATTLYIHSHLLQITHFMRFTEVGELQSLPLTK